MKKKERMITSERERKFEKKKHLTTNNHEFYLSIFFEIGALQTDTQTDIPGILYLYKIRLTSLQILKICLTFFNDLRSSKKVPMNLTANNL
jgi:hypothetical protein